MNMNKALQNLYHAVSGSTTTKVNISKLLVDIHQAITGKESPNKNNWAKIINSMADNWPGGGGGSSDFSTAQVTIINNTQGSIDERECVGCIIIEEDEYVVGIASLYHSFFPQGGSLIFTVPLYKGECLWNTGASLVPSGYDITSVIGDATYGYGSLTITGDCTITIS